MAIFDFDNYKDWVLFRIKSMPKGGRGEQTKLANHLRMHSTAVSQIFRGDKDLTIEQACGLCEYFALTSLETDYFLSLLLRARAGSKAMRLVYTRQGSQIREQAQQISARVPKQKQLSESDRAIFYSQWYYSAIRVLTSIPGCQTVDRIANRMQLSKSTVSRAVEFLLNCGMLIETDGKLRVGPQFTHLEGTSPLISRHHGNWRLKAMERHEDLSPTEELAYSGLMSLSHKDCLRIRSKLVEMIEQIAHSVADSPSEALYCVNIDWFQPLRPTIGALTAPA